MTPHGPRPVRKTRPGPRVGLVLSVVVAFGTLIVLFGLGAAAENRGRGGSPAAGNRPVAAGSAPATTAAKAPGLGDPVRDGKFEFVVSRIDCSRSTVGLEHLKRTAAGKYCLISLSIRNIGDRSQIFLAGVQKVADAGGTEFSNDEFAGLLANRDTQTFLRKIGPGSKVTGKIVFDVPKATTLTTMELHDSYLSGGVRVALPQKRPLSAVSGR
jgi:hypothetical protein